jgi:lipopolysaccharide transport system ATP-binding protein
MIQPLHTSSTSDTAIRVRGLSKSYTIQKGGLEKQSTLAESAIARLKNPFKRAEKETFDALKDIDLDIKKGEVVGIIGRNGAGKSTLLKVLSRITYPTTGQIDLYGRVGSLLEVGTGFHPELTGRENIYLNGSILGMSRSEIKKEFDAIVDFAGVEKFLDTPVKRSSSGMYVRLAFAVAAHLRTEILIVDEVLAVGDQEFQRKCLGKMKDVAKGDGRTVLFVSHLMQSVRVLCRRGIFLEQGVATYIGDAGGAIDRYVHSFAQPALTQSDPDRRPGSGEFRFTSVTATKDHFACGEPKVIRYTIDRRKPYEGKYFISAHIVSSSGVMVAQCDSRMVGHWVDASDSHEGTLTFTTPWLKPGDYRVELFICCGGVMDRFDEACQLNVIPVLPYPAAGNTEASRDGVVFGDYAYLGPI